MTRLRAGSAIAASVLLVAADAGAQPTEGEKKAAAQALFDEAQALTNAGNYAGACPKLAESLRLDPSMGTRFYLAQCLERTGKLASAWTYYVEVADAARAAGQKAREKYAADRADAIKPRLPKLAIKVSDAARAVPGLEIKRNGAVVGDAQWGIAIPVDQGTHAISAIAPGKKAWASDVEVKQEGQLVEVAVPALEDTPPPPPPPPPPPRVEVKTPPPPPPPPSPPRGTPPQKIAGYVVGAAGVVGLGASFALGGVAIAKKNESNANGCDAASNVCNAAGLQLRQDALGVATGSSVAFGVGLAAIGAGVVLVVTAPSTDRRPGVAIGPTGASLTWRW